MIHNESSRQLRMNGICTVNELIRSSEDQLPLAELNFFSRPISLISLRNFKKMMFYNRKFPVRLTLAMSIDKSQGRSSGICGIKESFCFSNGHIVRRLFTCGKLL